MTDAADLPAGPSPQERYLRAKAEGVPFIYANGFQNTIGISDIVVVLERNDDPVAVINLSYTMAKSLATSLGVLISQIESRAGREIMTTMDIERIFASSGEGK